MTTTPKQPQDRKPKQESKAGEPEPEAFSFTHDGETYTLKPTAEHVSPGFLRRHRRDDEMDVTFTMLEMLADEETLEVIDNMSWAEHTAFQQEFGEHINAFFGASMGESGRS